MKSWLKPNWPAPTSIMAYVTTRQNGFSQDPYDQFNLATHCGDQADRVALNRQYLARELNLPAEPLWLNQVHQNQVIHANDYQEGIAADGIYTQQMGQVCAVLTADCLPILLCDQEGQEVAALHAGWRGLADGIIQAGVMRFSSPSQKIMAWLGPAISQPYFEVGPEVYEIFVQQDPLLAQAFKPSLRSQHYLADLYAIARHQLNTVGINAVYGGDYCTYRQADLFYSYRRAHPTGRMATLIWLKT